MFNFMFKDRRTELEKEIDSVLKWMEDVSPSTDEYTAAAENLKRLHECHKQMKSRFVSPDMWAQIAANLAIVVMVMKHEELNVLTSKFAQFLVKWRVV